ncbi:MAG: hypothetical protein FH758_08790 [Firmicutes bacterium]|nr:hypothetical protein [Bacillota bacterium]
MDNPRITQAYGVLALNNLIETGIVEVNNKIQVLEAMDKAMFDELDSLSEEEAEKRAQEMLQG